MWSTNIRTVRGREPTEGTWSTNIRTVRLIRGYRAVRGLIRGRSRAFARPQGWPMAYGAP
eukprot:5859786-Prymnesium_polylepis.1